MIAWEKEIRSPAGCWASKQNDCNRAVSYTHLVLLDLGLPDMDGLEVLEQFSDLPQEVPTIIISARDRESEKVKALDMGADD